MFPDKGTKLLPDEKKAKALALQRVYEVCINFEYCHLFIFVSMLNLDEVLAVIYFESLAYS